MAKRTSTLSMFPWQGGLVTSINEGLLQPGQLTVADNLLFGYDTGKKRREGINRNYDDGLIVIGQRSSSSTTRTVVMAEEGYSIAAGDRWTFLGSSVAAYNQQLATITAVTDESVTASGVDVADDEIDAVAHGLSNDDWVFYRSSGDVIGGLTDSTAYYVVDASTDAFSLAASVGGSAIPFTSAGSGTQTFSRTLVSYTGTGSLAEALTESTGLTIQNKVVGGIDYWFGTSDSKTQYLITTLENGATYRTLQGTRNRILDGGLAWAVPLTEANMEVFANRVVIAVSGVTNRMKYWDGNPAQPLRDVVAAELLTSVSRSSTGTTRTIVMSGNVTTADGDPIVVMAPNAPAYEGSFTLLSGSGTTTITYTAATALEELSTADTDILLGPPAPLAKFIRQHQGNLLANDKTRLDFLHYSGTFNMFQWGGVGDSGGFPVGEGDGDPDGLSGISPTFKSTTFVGKRTKLYRLDGTDPDLYVPVKISDGIGFISHQAIAAIDQDDVFFASDRGFHSISATNAYGDFVSAYISKDIQKSFVEDWAPSRKRFIRAAYIPEINSALFAVSEQGSSFNNSLYLFNIEYKWWYRWPNIQAETLISAQDADRRRLYLGLLSGRLAQTLTGQNVDISETGTTSTIASNATTGLIFPDSRPDQVKGYKRLMLVYQGDGSYTITATVKIDNYATQAVSFSSNEAAVPLQDFVLGEDVLGGSFVTAPYSLPVDGYGRGIKISVQQNDLNTSLAIQGIMVEFEQAGDMAETRNSTE